MFKNLSERLTGIFDKLKSRGSLTESDVDLALREVRVAFLEADVSLEVVKEFLEKAKKKAVGSKIVKSISPSQMVIKIVNDTLKEILGNKEEPINLKATPPVILLMVGLQGSGKTTTSAKIAKKLNLRFVPDLRFSFDDTFEYANKIEKILNEPKVLKDL